MKPFSVALLCFGAFLSISSAVAHDTHASNFFTTPDTKVGDAPEFTGRPQPDAWISPIQNHPGEMPRVDLIRSVPSIPGPLQKQLGELYNLARKEQEPWNEEINALRKRQKEIASNSKNPDTKTAELKEQPGQSATNLQPASQSNDSGSAAANTKNGSAHGTAGVKNGAAHIASSTQNGAASAAASTQNGAVHGVASTQNGAAHGVASTQNGAAHVIASTQNGAVYTAANTQNVTDHTSTSAQTGADHTAASTESGVDHVAAATENNDTHVVASPHNGSGNAITSTKKEATLAAASAPTGTNKEDASTAKPAPDLSWIKSLQTDDEVKTKIDATRAKIQASCDSLNTQMLALLNDEQKDELLAMRRGTLIISSNARTDLPAPVQPPAKTSAQTAAKAQSPAGTNNASAKSAQITNQNQAQIFGQSHGLHNAEYKKHDIWQFLWGLR